MPETPFVNKLIAFCQEKGYVWGPSPELYGGLSGFYEYGPLGKLLKNNIENSLRRIFALHNFWEVECPTIMPAAIWKASGHLENFTDPMIKCSKCGATFRADNLIREVTGKEVQEKEYVTEVRKLRCPSCKGNFLPEIKRHNLMMKTTIGLDTEAYNRPETATTTYLPFPRYFDYFRKKLPFGVFQIGKAYRNEISPRQFTLRMREFTQAEAQLFLFHDQKQGYEGYAKIKKEKLPFWSAQQQEEEKDPETLSIEHARKEKLLKNDAYAFTLAVAYKLFKAIGVPDERIRVRQHASDEKAFYADDAWDIEVNLNSFGWTEMCGIHDRTDYDLKQHEAASKKTLSVSDETHKKEIPHILEIAFGPDRMAFTVLDLFYDPKAMDEGKSAFRIPRELAPIQVAIFPLVKKDGMPEIADEIHEILTTDFIAVADASGSIGRRYLRAAEQGIPYCITIDGQTLEDHTVTLRDRDTEKQVRVKKENLPTLLHDLLKGKKEFEDL